MAGNNNFVHFNTVFEERSNNFGNFSFKIFFIEVFFLDTRNLFLSKILSLTLLILNFSLDPEYHFGQAVSIDSFSNSNLVYQKNSVIELFLDISCIIRAFVVNESKAFVI
jgi:hypothetical protein